MGGIGSKSSPTGPTPNRRLEQDAISELRVRELTSTEENLLRLQALKTAEAQITTYRAMALEADAAVTPKTEETETTRVAEADDPEIIRIRAEANDPEIIRIRAEADDSEIIRIRAEADDSELKRRLTEANDPEIIRIRAEATDGPSWRSLAASTEDIIRIRALEAAEAQIIRIRAMADIAKRGLAADESTAEAVYWRRRLLDADATGPKAHVDLASAALGGALMLLAGVALVVVKRVMRRSSLSTSPPLDSDSYSLLM